MVRYRRGIHSTDKTHPMSFFFAARTQGAAALSLTKPAHAAYGDSANVFGKVSNPTGTYISNLQMRFDFE